MFQFWFKDFKQFFIPKITTTINHYHVFTTDKYRKCLFSLKISFILEKQFSLVQYRTIKLKDGEFKFSTNKITQDDQI